MDAELFCTLDKLTHSFLGSTAHLMCGFVAAGQPAAIFADLSPSASIKPAISVWQEDINVAAALMHDWGHKHSRAKHELLVQGVCFRLLQYSTL